MENLVRVVLVSRKEMWMTEERDVAIRAEWKWNRAVGDILISFFKLKAVERGRGCLRGLVYGKTEENCDGLKIFCDFFLNLLILHNYLLT